VQRVQFSCTHMGERELSDGVGESRCEADCVVTVDAAVNTYENILKHVASLYRLFHDDRYPRTG
jgi:hypothetical protein